MPPPLALLLARQLATGAATRPSPRPILDAKKRFNLLMTTYSRALRCWQRAVVVDTSGCTRQGGSGAKGGGGGAHER
jgi:hypothetical protein